MLKTPVCQGSRHIRILTFDMQTFCLFFFFFLFFYDGVLIDLLLSEICLRINAFSLTSASFSPVLRIKKYLFKMPGHS